MKRIILAALLAFPLIGYAQVRKEHTYSPGVSWHAVDENEEVFIRTDANNVMSVYSSSHNLIVELSLNDYATNPGIIDVAKRLFNTDDKLEFLLISYVDMETIILNEDGEVLFQRAGTPYVHQQNGRSKLLINSEGQTTVYSLPGNMPHYAHQLALIEQAISGVSGSTPQHEWDGTSLRFQNADQTWGEYVNLQGPQGAEGAAGPMGPEGPQGEPGVPGEDGVCDCENVMGIGDGDVIEGLSISNPSPNPANTYTVIEYDISMNVGACKLAVFNESGKMVHSTTIDSYSGTVNINTSNLAPGVYYYRIHSSKGVSSAKKLIVAR